MKLTFTLSSDRRRTAPLNPLKKYLSGEGNRRWAGLLTFELDEAAVEQSFSKIEETLLLQGFLEQTNK